MPRSSRLARLRYRFDATGLRAAMALPERVQRALLRKPLVRDGQTLASDLQLMLVMKEVLREPNAEDLPVVKGRALLRRQQQLVGGTQPIGSVRELSVAGMAARLYTPTSVEAGSSSAEPGSSSVEPGSSSVEPVETPLLLWLHGGGWIYGDLDSHDATCRFLAERAGVRVLAVDYRLAPEDPFPAALDDSLAAYRWVLDNAASLGADPQRLAIGGDSAGGNLSAVVAIEAAREGLPLAFQLLVYPGTDMRGGTPSREMFGQGLMLTTPFIDLARTSYTPEPAQWEDPRVSPLLAEIPAGLAPAYVATAGFDPLRDEGEAYARKLADAGVEVELKRFPDQIHGFIQIVGPGRTSRAACAEVAAKLRAALVR